MSVDWIEPYLVFYNTHDGSGSLKAALTPIRVTCQNTLNLALRRAKRSRSTKHTGDIRLKLEDARETLLRAEQYMDELGNEMNYLANIRISDHEADAFIRELITLPKNATKTQQRNTEKLKLYMGDAEIAENDRYRITWKNSRTERLDTKALKQEQPEIYRKYARTAESRRFLVKPVV